jgi:hypothetical protein
MRYLVALLVILSAASSAHAQLDPCDPHSPSGGDRSHPLLGQLRWDLAADALEVARGGTDGAGLTASVTKLHDSAYFLNFDYGVRGTVAQSFTSVKALDLLAELEVRWYPIKDTQTTGIDQCGCGTKTRRWSNTHDAVGYILLLGGYGHERESGVGSRDALTASVGLGYEINLTDDATTCIDPNLDPTTPKTGTRRSLFAQAGFRFDVAGNADQVNRVGGWFLEAGIRF